MLRKNCLPALGCENCLPALGCRGRFPNCFVALEEIGPEKGQLWIAPASHLRGVRPNHQAEAYGGHREALTPPSNQLQMPTLHAGDVVRTAQPTSCEQGRDRTLTMPASAVR